MHLQVTNSTTMSGMVFPAEGYPGFRRAYSLKKFRSSESCGSLAKNVLVYDECQGTVLPAKNGYGVSALGGGMDLTFQGGAGLYFLGLGWQWRKDIMFVVYPYKRKSYLFARLDRSHGKRALTSGLGRWRSVFSGATEEKRSTNFKTVNAPAKFVRSPQKQGSHCGNSNREVRGQPNDFTALTMAGNGLVESPEVYGTMAKVVAGGSGAPAILSFCQQSSLLPTAQFWYSSDVASEPVLPSDIDLSKSARNGFDDEGITDTPTTHESNKETVFLVLGVGSGVGLGTVTEQLKAVRSRGCLAVGIFIQPFMFEGPKRLEQASQLIGDMLRCTDILLVVEQDGLLRRDIVTVSEASTLAKNAVLLSIKTIAELLSVDANVSLDTQIEHNHATAGDTMKILKHAGKAWLGSGRGNTSREAIEMAMAEAPISDYRPFGAKRLVLCTVASCMDPSKEELGAWKSFLHQTLGPELQLIISTVRNPMLENKVKLAIIIIARVSKHQVASQFSDNDSSEYGMLSMIGINTAEKSGDLKQSSFPSTSKSAKIGHLESCQDKTAAGTSVVPNGAMSDNGSASLNQGKSVGGTKISRPGTDRTPSPQKAKRPPPHQSLGKRSSSVYNYRSPIREDIRFADARQLPAQASTASAASQKLRLAWEAGPSSEIAEAWAQARAEAREPAKVTSALDVSLPVGVKMDPKQSSQATSENFTFGAGVEVAEDKWSGTDVVPVDPDALPKNRMMDMGLEAVRDMYIAASALVMGRDMNDDRRQASLSQRAASMLESERSQTKLTPLVEMGFKNGVYKGRCQGGLPEGKGRLSFSDGSFYDGQWRQGKRAGSGAFYYSNGDMFQGSWKDDVMHGKGWMYYHNGDRLYANFWKGRADGEGRFYSAQGDVFFGQFRENWRHGEFLFIEASGVRWTEIWEHGILHSRTPADGRIRSISPHGLVEEET